MGVGAAMERAGLRIEGRKGGKQGGERSEGGRLREGRQSGRREERGVVGEGVVGKGSKREREGWG